MIKIISAKYHRDYWIDLEFSDGTHGTHDFTSLVAKDAPLVTPIRDYDSFREFYLELGALCWKHGLELSAWSLQEKLKSLGKLETAADTAA
ncbi:MAG: DUF2442 domain-containing protein [Gammaproteobacteria bacterium]|nr:DUF2442 domain-containing protein [Gammaproteobacteria bacterium]